MSIHLHKPNYRCPRCTSIFLPYKIGMQCPNCGMAIEDADTEEYLDTVDRIAGSMKIHKMEHGMYFPGAWLTSNIMDHVQGIIYQIFDAMETTKPENEESYLADLLENKFGWDGQEYLKAHIREITLEVFEIYKAKNFSEIKHMKKSLTKWQRTKRWFRKFLP